MKDTQELFPFLSEAIKTTHFLIESIVRNAYIKGYEDAKYNRTPVLRRNGIFIEPETEEVKK